MGDDKRAWAEAIFGVPGKPFDPEEADRMLRSAPIGGKGVLMLTPRDYDRAVETWGPLPSYVHREEPEAVEVIAAPRAVTPCEYLAPGEHRTMAQRQAEAMREFVAVAGHYAGPFQPRHRFQPWLPPIAGEVGDGSGGDPVGLTMGLALRQEDEP